MESELQVQIFMFDQTGPFPVSKNGEFQFLWKFINIDHVVFR